jgi:hypothetical protein
VNTQRQAKAWQRSMTLAVAIVAVVLSLPCVVVLLVTGDVPVGGLVSSSLLLLTVVWLVLLAPGPGRR